MTFYGTQQYVCRVPHRLRAEQASLEQVVVFCEEWCGKTLPPLILIEEKGISVVYDITISEMPLQRKDVLMNAAGLLQVRSRQVNTIGDTQFLLGTVRQRDKCIKVRTIGDIRSLGRYRGSGDTKIFYQCGRHHLDWHPVGADQRVVRRREILLEFRSQASQCLLPCSLPKLVLGFEL